MGTYKEKKKGSSKTFTLITQGSRSHGEPPTHSYFQTRFKEETRNTDALKVHFVRTLW